MVEESPEVIADQEHERMLRSYIRVLKWLCVFLLVCFSIYVYFHPPQFNQTASNREALRNSRMNTLRIVGPPEARVSITRVAILIFKYVSIPCLNEIQEPMRSEYIVKISEPIAYKIYSTIYKAKECTYSNKQKALMLHVFTSTMLQLGCIDEQQTQEEIKRIKRGKLPSFMAPAAEKFLSKLVVREEDLTATK